MPLLIDTYNVLHTTGILPPDLAGIDVQGLIGLLKASRFQTESITLACDGTPKTSDTPKPDTQGLLIQIRYSGAGKTADDFIAQVIGASTAPRRLVVVSSDHAVLRTARKRHCKTLTSEEFLAQLAIDANLPPPVQSPLPAKPPPGSMTGAQVDTWINVFQIDPNAPVAEPPNDDASSSSETADEVATVNDGELKELPTGVALPSELIEQAERLWARENHARSPAPTPPPLPCAPTSAPKASDHTDRSSSSESAEDSDRALEESIDAIDMNALLPNDGKTMRSTKRD